MKYDIVWFFTYIFPIIVLFCFTFFIAWIINLNRLNKKEKEEVILFDESCMLLIGIQYISSLLCRVRLFESFMTISTYRKMVIPYSHIKGWVEVDYLNKKFLGILHEADGVPSDLSVLLESKEKFLDIIRTRTDV